MRLPADKGREFVRLVYRRCRDFCARRKAAILGVSVMCAVAFWFGVERGLLDGSELCVAPQAWVAKPMDCYCERDRSRWRYGQCHEDPVDWVIAELIVVAEVDGPWTEKAEGPVALAVQRVLRGTPPENGKILLHANDMERLQLEMRDLGGPAAGERFLAMFRVWSTGEPRSMLLRDGYYPVFGSGEAAAVRLRPRDIQIFHADSGEPYTAPPETAPLRDFEYSLRLAEPSS